VIGRQHEVAIALLPPINCDMPNRGIAERETIMASISHGALA